LRLSISKAAKELGGIVDSLRCWESAGKIEVERMLRPDVLAGDE
jgi:hypothetical protein